MDNKRKTIIKNKKQRKRRIRAKSKQVADGKLRLSVFRSLKHIYAQLIDDKKGKTIVSANDLQIKNSKNKDKTKKAFEVGKLIAEKAKKELSKSKKNKIKIFFDRGQYQYHGRVKALAEGAKKEGLEF